MKFKSWWNYRILRMKLTKNGMTESKISTVRLVSWIVWLCTIKSFGTNFDARFFLYFCKVGVNFKRMTNRKRRRVLFYNLSSCKMHHPAKFVHWTYSLLYTTFLSFLFRLEVSSQCRDSWAWVSHISSTPAGKTESGTWLSSTKVRGI